nr:potassium/sodium hyperpolarization-activated cyclic nucleotide-gated channel 2-like [Pongo abelii]
MSFQPGDSSLSSPASARGRSYGALAGVRGRGPGSLAQLSLPPSPPPRRRPRPALCPGRSVLGRPRSRRRLTKLPLCPAASAGPADVSLCDQPGRAEHGRRRPLAAGGGGANPGAPPSRGQPFREPAPTRSGRGCPREKVQAPRWHSGPAPQASPALPSAVPFPSNARALPTASWSLPSSESMICSPPGPAGNHHMQSYMKTAPTMCQMLLYINDTHQLPSPQQSWEQL